MNPDEKGALNPQEFSLPADIKHQKTGQTYEQESFLIFCLFQFLHEFPVPPKKRTASGFIKIYEPNHHWKYKTVVGAQGEIGEEREQVERGEEMAVV